ncbi:MAG: riboflavin kinase [Alistipes sp.]|nr:riboflavin kinase [Alistipes sp.]MBR0340018.1 riboflavin kinase [Alistipes sp.]
MQIVEGVVIGGNRLGRKLGFPTANIAIDERLDIENGVYCSRVIVEGESYVAMTNVGVRPSVDGSKRLLETHLFGFEGLLYGLTLRVELYDKIRDEKRFDSVDELRRQIEKDSNKIKELMANCQ